MAATIVKLKVDRTKPKKHVDTTILQVPRCDCGLPPGAAYRKHKVWCALVTAKIAHNLKAREESNA